MTARAASGDVPLFLLRPRRAGATHPSPVRGSGESLDLLLPASYAERVGLMIEAGFRQSLAEPRLDEVLRNPVIRLMMKCDNVTEAQLLDFIATAAGRNKTSELGN